MKFQTKKHANIVINELFCIKLAKKINLNVAVVELYRFKEHPVKRFDRIYKENKVERLHVIDGSQMLVKFPVHFFEAFWQSLDDNFSQMF